MMPAVVLLTVQPRDIVSLCLTYPGADLRTTRPLSYGPWRPPGDAHGFLKYAPRPVEVGTNIEVEALLLSGRRSLLA